MTSKISLLITGASTGIGRALAIALVRDGHQVFASVRKEADAAALRAEESEIKPLLFDVTDTPALAAAVAVIQKERRPGTPFSLINNAGIAVPGPLEDVPLADFRRQFEVNVFGALAATQAFLPLVRDGRGRIINMSSVAGRFTTPFLGAYSASKYALEAMSDALRQELAADGIKVLLVEPGPVQTPIWDKNLNAPRTSRSERYVKALDRFEVMVRKSADRGLPPDSVVRAVRRALFEKSPPLRQVVTSFENRVGFELGRHLPSSWIDRIIASQLFRK